MNIQAVVVDATTPPSCPTFPVARTVIRTMKTIALNQNATFKPDSLMFLDTVNLRPSSFGLGLGFDSGVVFCLRPKLPFKRRLDLLGP